ncbi:MAG: hypothetical protein Unbinned706contig1000_45 [Prokaryotic dsDNA virus sp.]|nr:MAG: hypothetical protein Unbinned706contig1000_45 [Prokaryotic dsDNA virus sp.]|tara:strand:+ start:36054 stop:36254 length:201 start_codon:yes stop_codon:yes gene_type:complete
MSKLTNEENIIYQLETLASYDPSDIDNPEFEVAYEMPTGEESFATVCCTDLAVRALKLIRSIESKE